MKIRGLLALAIAAAMFALTAVAGAADTGGLAGEMVAFVRQGNIWIARVDGTGERRLTDFGACGGPALSPDGKQAAFHCRGEQEHLPGYGLRADLPGRDGGRGAAQTEAWRDSRGGAPGFFAGRENPRLRGALRSPETG